MANKGFLDDIGELPDDDEIDPAVPDAGRPAREYAVTAAAPSAAAVVISQSGEVEPPSNAITLASLPEPEDVGEVEGDLTPIEQDQLDQCHRAFRQYAGAEAVAIKAMLVVRSRRLYRQTHPTFEAFVEEVWHQQKTWVNRQIGRYLVTEAVGLDPMGSKLLPERQARELTGLLKSEGPEAVQKVWSQATERAESPTAETLRGAREDLYPRPRSRPGRPAVSREVKLVRQLGTTPSTIAASLRAGLDDEAFAELAELLADSL